MWPTPWSCRLTWALCRMSSQSPQAQAGLRIGGFLWGLGGCSMKQNLHWFCPFFSSTQNPTLVPMGSFIGSHPEPFVLLMHFLTKCYAGLVRMVVEPAHSGLCRCSFGVSVVWHRRKSKILAHPKPQTQCQSTKGNGFP